MYLFLLRATLHEVVSSSTFRNNRSNLQPLLRSITTLQLVTQLSPSAFVFLYEFQIESLFKWILLTSSNQTLGICSLLSTGYWVYCAPAWTRCFSWNVATNSRKYFWNGSWKTGSTTGKVTLTRPSTRRRAYTRQNARTQLDARTWTRTPTLAPSIRSLTRTFPHACTHELQTPVIRQAAMVWIDVFCPRGLCCLTGKTTSWTCAR